MSKQTHTAHPPHQRIQSMHDAAPLRDDVPLTSVLVHASSEATQALGFEQKLGAKVDFVLPDATRNPFIFPVFGESPVDSNPRRRVWRD